MLKLDWYSVEVGWLQPIPDRCVMYWSGQWVGWKGRPGRGEVKGQVPDA